ncbi:MAG: polymer-forming cytoskeletal protein [Betaproteobacteria bacterium]|nr:polymer-forming cytoskeletal protein [Betaproteobacteria bacterium]
MKKAEPSYNDREIRAFLEEGCEFDGKLNFSGVVRLNGRFHGDIDSEDTLIIGETATIEGNIRVGFAIVGGKVIGDIMTKHCTEILATGIIEGSVTSPALISHEGAQLHGHMNVRREMPNLSLVASANGNQSVSL